ncbi:MAG: calcium-binding protein, partial [Dolichospermum sp.]
ATSTAEAISAVLLEEIGHYVDAQINLSDSAGDEGAIFAALVQGNSLDTTTLQALKAEDDHATITVNGQNIQVEQQNFTGTNGNDTITGTSGNDTINSGLGIDVVNGGAGDDLLIIDYSIGDTGSEMVLSSSAGTEGFQGSAYRYNSAYSAFLDRVDFSGINRFQITGTSKGDSIVTGSGNDTINGGAGNDDINGGAGNDTIDGGAGVDTLTLDLSTQTGNIVINNATAGINLTGIVTATNFENFTITTGSGNDTITHSGLVNNIVVRSNESITAGAGNDTFNTGLGNDVADGGTGDDLLIIDYSIGDTGSGMVLSSSAGTEGFQGSAYRYNSAYSAELDRVDFSGINRFQITGTGTDDSITTGGGNDTINGGEGNDTINGGAGNDTINGGD